MYNNEASFHIDPATQIIIFIYLLVVVSLVVTRRSCSVALLPEYAYILYTKRDQDILSQKEETCCGSNSVKNCQTFNIRAVVCTRVL